MSGRHRQSNGLGTALLVLLLAAAVAWAIIQFGGR